MLVIGIVSHISCADFPDRSSSGLNLRYKLHKIKNTRGVSYVIDMQINTIIKITILQMIYINKLKGEII